MTANQPSLPFRPGVVSPQSRGSRARLVTQAGVATPRDTCRLPRAQKEHTKSYRRANCLTQRRKDAKTQGRKDARAQRRKGRLQHPDTSARCDGQPRLQHGCFVTASAAALCFCCSHASAVLCAFALSRCCSAVAVPPLPLCRWRSVVEVSWQSGASCDAIRRCNASRYRWSRSGWRLGSRHNPSPAVRHGTAETPHECPWAGRGRTTTPMADRYPDHAGGISSIEKYTALPLLRATSTISSAPTDAPPIRRQPSHFATSRRDIG